MPVRSRDRVARALSHREPDRVPFDAIGCDVVPDPGGLPADYCEYCRTGEFRYLTFQPPPAGKERFGRYLPDLPPGASVSYWGIASVPIATSDGFHAGHTYWHPLAAVGSVREFSAFHDLSSALSVLPRVVEGLRLPAYPFSGA